MKTLYLVRHAKSSWKHPELSDIDRPLNKRGKNNAPLMAERLAERLSGTVIDQVIASPAKRAQSTAKKIAVGTGFDWQQIDTARSLYFDGIRAMLELIRETSEEHEHLMLVGHNPDMTDFLNELVGHVTYNMPTCAIATIKFDSSWSEIDFNMGALINYDYPKKTSDDQ